MSIIYITEHDELIYDVIKAKKKIEKRIYRYTPDLEVPDISISGKQKCGTMGPARYTPPNPRNYLRKNAKKTVIKKRPDSGGYSRYVKPKLPPIPPYKNVKHEKDPDTEKNFIKANVKNLLKKTFPKKEPRFVDTRNGTVHKVEKSGLDPYYLKSHKFGKPPVYLLSRVANKKRELQHETDKDDLNTLSKCHYITRQEREDLLTGLKQNWEELQKNYQLLPMITDTTPKILKKSKMEKDLKELEKDIHLIEMHPYIYIHEEETK